MGSWALHAYIGLARAWLLHW